jgi:hypothetical protein
MASVRTAPTPRRMAKHLLVSKPGSHFKQQCSIDMGVYCIQCLVLFHFCSITRSRKPDKLSGFAISFLFEAVG